MNSVSYTSSAHEVLSTLADVAHRNREGRFQLAQVIDRVRETLQTEREEKAAALGEVERLGALVASLQAQNQQLSTQNQMLTREVHTLAAAIQVANQEITESDAMLAEAMAAVSKEVEVSYPAPVHRPAEPLRNGADPAAESMAALERMLSEVAKTEASRAA